jgi:NADH dehydrogenase
VLLDGAPRVLGAFAPNLSEHARNALEDLGVSVTLESQVVDIDADGVTVSGDGAHLQRIDARTVVWAAGAGRLEVEDDLTLAGRPEVFALGDMISIPGVPGTAQPAIQEGKYVARVIQARLQRAPVPPSFTYRDLGSMAIIGRNQAVAELFTGTRLWGLPAFFAWGAIHLAYLVGWGSRVETVARWGWTLLARNRRERLISVLSLAGPVPAVPPVADGQSRPGA